MPKALFQDKQSTGHGSSQCDAHVFFEKFLAESMKNLGDKLATLAEAVTAQSKANGEAIAKVLEGQANRRELCGRQGARIDNLEQSDEEQWTAINEMRKAVWMGRGAMVACASFGGIIVALSQLAIKAFFN